MFVCSIFFYLRSDTNQKYCWSVTLSLRRFICSSIQQKGKSYMKQNDQMRNRKRKKLISPAMASSSIYIYICMSLFIFKCISEQYSTAHTDVHMCVIHIQHNQKILTTTFFVLLLLVRRQRPTHRIYFKILFISKCGKKRKFDGILQFLDRKIEEKTMWMAQKNT